MQDAGVEIKPDLMLDAAEFHLMCNLLISALDDELHGAARSRMERGTGALGLQLMAAAPSLHAAIRSLADFYRLAGSFCSLTLREHESYLDIVIRSDVERGPLAFVTEEIMANWLHVQLCYSTQLALPLVRFVTTGDHPHNGRQHPYLMCPVTAGPRTVLSVRRVDLLRRPTVTISDNPRSDAVLFWLGCMAERRGHDTARYDGRLVSLATLNLMRSGSGTLSQCGAELHLADRDYRRALFEEGTSFRELSKAALVERVRTALLRDNALCLDDLAADIGYSDARSLRRAIRWATGRSIAELRQGGTGSATIGDPKVVWNLRQQLLS